MVCQGCAGILEFEPVRERTVQVREAVRIHHEQVDIVVLPGRTPQNASRDSEGSGGVRSNEIKQVVFRLVHELFQRFAVRHLIGPDRGVARRQGFRREVRFLNIQTGEQDEGDGGAIPHGVAAESLHRAAVGFRESSGLR